MAGAQHKLFVTHACGEGPFLRVCGQADPAAAALLEAAVEREAQQAPTCAPGTVGAGSLCLACYSDGRWYRAHVLEAVGGMLAVHFIDYGNRSSVPVNAIKPIDESSQLLSINPQASEYILARVVQPAGRWDPHIEEKIRADLCYAEYDCIPEATVANRRVVSIFDGVDRSERLVTAGFGVAVPTELHISLLEKYLGESVAPPPFRLPNPDETQVYREHVQFAPNRSFPSNPASTMRMHNYSTGVPLGYPQLSRTPPTAPVAPSPISQRLLNIQNTPSAPRNVANLKPTARQAFASQRVANAQQERAAPESPAQKTASLSTNPSSPSKMSTYKNRLLEVGSQHNVFISYALDGPEIFAVQLCSNINRLKIMTDEINRRPHSSLSAPPMLGSVCLGKMSGDGVICRAIVVNMSGKHCKLFFVDFGDTELVSYYDIFDIPDEFVKFETFALRFCLSGIKQLKPSPALNEAFRRLVEGTAVTLKVVAPEGPPLLQYGELYINGKNVLDILKEEACGDLEFRFMDMLPAGVKRSVMVSYVDSCIKFFVQLSENIEALNKVMAAVDAHCEASRPLSAVDLKPNVACCALFPDDKAWYRAQILTAKGDKATVWYVDYGNEQEVSAKDLRSITSDLVELPAQAIKCALKGFEDKPVESKTSNQLEMLALEKTLQAHVVGQLADHVMLVTLVDESVSPPLDIANRMVQLSQPRFPRDAKSSPPASNHTEQMISSPEGSVQSEKNRFRSDQMFREDRRKDGDEWGQRPGSFRGRNERENKSGLERSAPGRHSEKYPRGHRSDRQVCKPRENGTEENDEWAEQAPGGRPNPRDRRKPKFEQQDDKKAWKIKGEHPKRRQGYDSNSSESSSQHGSLDSSQRPGGNAHSVQHRLRRDNFNKSEQGESKGWGEKREKKEWTDRKDRGDKDSWGEKKTYGNRNDNRGENNWGEKKDNWGEKKDNWVEKKDNWGEKKDSWGEKKSYQDNRGERRERSNFTPRDRIDKPFDGNRSFGSNSDSGKPGYKPRGKFTQVTYKELPNPVSPDTQFTNHEIEAGSQQEVSVAWFISPASFYAQITSHQGAFVEMMNKVPEIYKGVRHYTGTIDVGASILARFPEDGVLYRATVLGVQPFGKFIVQYIDFGNKFVVDSKDIWQLDQAMMELPKMAVHCSLAGVSPLVGTEWKVNKELDLCFNAPRYQCVFQECLDEKYKVSLWSDGTSVAELLAERNLARLSEQSSVTLKDEPIDLSMVIGQQMLCCVTHVESFDKFYIQLDLEKAALVESMIAGIDPGTLAPLAAGSLAPGTHCVLRTDGKVSRAILEDASDPEAVRAVLPDYGCTVTVPQGVISALPTELSVYYYQALECCLNNYTADSEKLMSQEELVKKLNGNQFLIYINDVEGIRVVSTLYDCLTGVKIPLFTPDEGAYDSVVPLCARAVYNHSFGASYISHVETLQQVYITKVTDGERVANLLDALFQFYEEGTHDPPESYEPDTLCAAKSTDVNWYRATILSATETECNVQFQDYGNTENIPKDNIKKLDPKFYEPYALALVVSLGLTPLQDNAVTKLTEMTTDKEVLVTLDIGDEGWLASLHLDGVNVGLKLVAEQLATTQQPPVNEKLETALVEPISLPPGTIQVYISHIDTPGLFWLQMSDKIEKIDEIQAELQEKSSAYVELVNRDMGTLCVAKFSVNDMWYRAEILDSDADITTVRFIDYGNTDVLDNDPELLKVIPDHLKDIERFAVKASVNAVPTGTGQWSEPASDYFTELVGDITVPIEALIVLKDITTYVDLFVNGHNLTDKLVSEKFAMRSEATECGDLASCFASHVNSPSEFWIQLENSTSELQSVEDAMADSESFPELTEKEEGLICAAKYPEDGLWYRAQIIVDGSEGTEVLFMDYGNASIATELRSLPDELKAKAALSRKCALQKPRNIKSWSRKSEVKFNEMAAEGATIFSVQFIASGDISIVELYLEGKSVTEALVSVCDAPPQCERPTPLGQDSISSGTVSHVNTSQDFYVRLEESNDKLDNIIRKLLEAKEFGECTDKNVGLFCAALRPEDEQWYRAKVIEICDDGAHVLFLDYGNKAKCKVFKQMPADLADIEPLAKNCSLVGYQETDEKTNAKFQEIVANDTLLRVEFLDTTKELKLVRLFLGTEDVGILIKQKDLSLDVVVEASTEVIENNDKPVIDEIVEELNIEPMESKENNPDQELDGSKVDLDDSLDSNATVIENTSHENDLQVTNEENSAVGSGEILNERNELLKEAIPSTSSPKKYASNTSPVKQLESISPVVSPKKGITPPVSPKQDSVSSVSPKKVGSPVKHVEITTPVSHKKDSNSSVSPKKDSTSSVSPKKDSTPSVSPKKDITPSVSPKRDSTPSVSPKKATSNAASSLKQVKSLPTVSPKKDSSSPVSSKNSTPAVSPKKVVSNIASSAKQIESTPPVSPKKDSTPTASPKKNSAASVSPKKYASNATSPVKQGENESNVEIDIVKLKDDLEVSKERVILDVVSETQAESNTEIIEQNDTSVEAISSDIDAE